MVGSPDHYNKACLYLIVACVWDGQLVGQERLTITFVRYNVLHLAFFMQNASLCMQIDSFLGVYKLV